MSNLELLDTPFTYHFKMPLSFTEEIDTAKSGIDETAHQEVIQEVHRLQSEYEDLQQRHEAQIRDNAQLSR